ncbi:MAG: SDR family oxidoreductase [Nitrospiraceae bacterium]
MTGATRTKTVVITGASTGIGAACARYLDGLGYHIFAGIRRPEDGRALQVTCSARVTPIRLDVTDAHSIAEAARLVNIEVSGVGLAGLVNNAGIAVTGPLEVLPIADLRTQLEVNVIGQIAVTQAFLPLLRKGRGRIINMGSIAGRATIPFMGPYSASKFSLEALTDALRLELQPWGIHVAIIEPGAIATPIWAKSGRAANELEEASNMEAKALYGEAIARVRGVVAKAIQRAIPPDAVAQAVVHALSSSRPKTRYLVGHDAKFRAALKALLPDRVQDALLTWFIGLPRHV